MGFKLKNLVPKFKGKTKFGKILHDIGGNLAKPLTDAMGIQTKFAPKTKVGTLASKGTSIISSIADMATGGMISGIGGTVGSIVAPNRQIIDSPYVQELPPVQTVPNSTAFNFQELLPQPTLVGTPFNVVQEPAPYITTAATGMPVLQAELANKATSTEKKKFSIKSLWDQYGKKALDSAMSAAKTSVADTYMGTDAGKKDQKDFMKYYIQKYIWIPVVLLVSILGYMAFNKKR